jgi:hypothetical protein
VTPIDELLARALLLDQPAIPRDVIPYVPCEDTDTRSLLDGPLWQAAGASRGQDCDAAGHDLMTLCEAVVVHTAAVSLRNFDTEYLPAPRGAKVLGCILQLADDEDGARFWWQYAAGAGDDTASYCLYLHHLSLGETDLATWWRNQTRIDTDPSPEKATVLFASEAVTTDASTPTVLRVLGRLLSRADRTRSAFVNAVMEYVPSAVAVGYVDNPDFEIPLPGPDFADTIGIILADTAAYSAGTGPSRRRSAAYPRLPGRPEHPRDRPSQPGQPCSRTLEPSLSDSEWLSNGLRSTTAC